MGRYSHSILVPATIAATLSFALAGCGEDPAPDAGASVLASDPLVARALNDPLMVDPDLAYRNEANAAVTLRYDHALPPLVATDELASLAREAARVELLEDGRTPALPSPVSDVAPANLAALRYAEDIVEALGGPTECSGSLESGLIWAAEMPDTASIMPHGMTQQAAGVENESCTLRVGRYLTPASEDDVLEYHFTKAARARLEINLYETPESMVVGDSRTEHFVASVRPGPGGLSAVDLVYWTK